MFQNHIIHLDGPDKTGKDTQMDMLVKGSKGKYLVINRSFISQIAYSRLYDRDINEDFFWDKMCHAYHTNKELFFLLCCPVEVAAKRFIEHNEKDISIDQFAQHSQMFFDVIIEARERYGIEIPCVSTENGREQTYRMLQYHIINEGIQYCQGCHLHSLDVNVKDIHSGHGKLIPKANTMFPKYMFVGMNPSKTRIRGTQHPFAVTEEEDKNAVFLDILQEIKVYDESYFTNLVKCSTYNNKITGVDVENCEMHLACEIEVFKPQIVVALGKDVYMYLAGIFPSTSVELRWIYHPAYEYAYKGVTAKEYREHIIKKLF